MGLDTTLYDPMLDMTVALGLAPPRFAGVGGGALERYFAMARGAPGIAPLDMSKWRVVTRVTPLECTLLSDHARRFDTNYHQVVPELDESSVPSDVCFDGPLSMLARAKAILGSAFRACPILIGPVTFVARSEVRGCSAEELVARLVPTYCALLAALAAAGAPEVQLHEHALATSAAPALRRATEAAYQALRAAAAGCRLNLVVSYDDPGDAYSWIVQLPVDAITLDFCGAPAAAHGSATLGLLRAHGFPRDKRLGAGVLDGRAVWADACAPAGQRAADVVAAILAAGVPRDQLCVTTSCSLHHLPYDTSFETQLPADLRPRLAFAVQKLSEVAALAASLPTLAPSHAAPSQRCAPGGGAAAAPDAALLHRAEPYATRRAKQLATPPFATSAIGSFPQTADVRRLRALLAKGTLSRAAYEHEIDLRIAHAVGLQEGLGLDVFVHGEAERTDMVEHSAQQLGGFAFTLHGWVQSYGSRCVRPPIITGDVSRPGGAMTLREFRVAQALTTAPVKGMLTGPVTILNWSFPRPDISRAAQAGQIAAAMREEVADLQAAGCRVIQVDEPALREGLPLKRERWAAYLAWATDAFRLATSVAAPDVQLVTHLCYSEFQDILGAIDALDADVLLIENSRSGDAMLRALAAAGYARDIGPGVYDVHSPVVPTAASMQARLQAAVAAGLQPQRLWVVPDCGLKTRRWEEVVPALRNMVAAAHAMRVGLQAKQAGGSG